MNEVKEVASTLNTMNEMMKLSNILINLQEQGELSNALYWVMPARRAQWKKVMLRRITTEELISKVSVAMADAYESIAKG